jgi:hypothetical protein
MPSVYFRAHLDEQIVLSNSPLLLTHWGHLIFDRSCAVAV